MQLEKTFDSNKNSNKELSYLYALALSVIKTKTMKSCHFGDYKEGEICINKQNRVWEVFYAECGRKYLKKSYTDCYNACIEVICRISTSTRVLGDLVTTFDRLIKNDFSKEELEKLIEDFGLNKNTRAVEAKNVKYNLKRFIETKTI